ncbi:MAG: CPBP family intramembrane metalloprotease [Candidatus Marinimicrobia bacterium]|nr:CPBP family intramembrane metalloprotease [Candidatus Neomarinimicrobiota bacterium]
MMSNSEIPQSYFDASRNLLYSLVVIFPMLFLYEFLGFINNFETNYQIRNGADAMIRQAFSVFGPNSQLIYGLALFLLFCSVGFGHRQILLKGEINIRFLVLMVCESFIWCGGLLITMKGINTLFLANPMTSNLLEQFYLSVGAGIWEELIFRLGLISVFTYIIRSVFRYGRSFSLILSLLFSGSIFSLFHYVGIYGDIFTWQTFILRTVAGVFLGAVFLFRGLGISVYTHIFYDMVLVSIPVLGLTS